MQPLRLAIVAPRFWPLVGDGPDHLLQLAEELLAAGHVVRVVSCQWRKGWPRQMTVGPVPLIRLPGSPRGGWKTIRWMYSLAGWLRAERDNLDAVLVAGLRHEASIAVRQHGASGPRVAAIVHEDELAWQAASPFGARLAAAAKSLDAIVVANGQLREALQAAGYSADRLHAIDRTVHPIAARARGAREAARMALAAVNYDLVTTDATQVVLAFGRLDVEHRFSDLVRAWRIVAARHGEARLWIIGDGPERDRLYRQVGDLDLRFRVLLPGTFDGSEDLLDAADAVVVPSSPASMARTTLETLARGLPVVAATCAAMQPFDAPEREPFHCAAGDVSSLAEALDRALTDREAARAWGAAAQAIARRRPTPAEEAERYADLLRALMDPSSTA